MDNVICHHIYYKHSVGLSGGQFNVFRNLKKHKLVEKPKLVLPYISPYLSCITCSCVQNTAADAATQETTEISSILIKTFLSAFEHSVMTGNYQFNFWNIYKDMDTWI